MGWGDWIQHEILGHGYRSQRPRRLTQDDITSFDIAATARPTHSQRTREELIEFIRLKNPVRWRRLRNDFKWLQKQVKKAGMNPEDARWLL